MFQKTNQRLLIIIAILVLAGVSVYFFWQQYSQTIPEEKPSTSDLTSASQAAKASFCSGGQNFLDENAQKGTLKQNFFIADQVENFRDYYFCQGFLKNDEQLACSADMYLNKSESQQCQSGFYFSSMILASLRGEKERAQEICQQNMNGGLLCDYISDLEKLARENACSRLSADSQKMCYAIFNGEEKYCDDFSADKKEECLVQSRVLKIMKGSDENNCDSLLLKEGTAEEVFSGAVKRAVVACKLYFDNSAQTCDAQYGKVAQSVCPNL